MPPNAKTPRVALLIESSRTYGRGVLRGIARYAHAHGPWSFYVVERALHGGVPDWLNAWNGDGIIARIEDRQMARKLSKFKCPVIDVLGQLPSPSVPSFDTDPLAVARIAVEFFTHAGFRHFAFCGYRGIPFSDRRADAFAQCLAERGHKLWRMPDLPSQRSPGHIQAVERQGIAAGKATARWLRDLPRPLAVLACNDIRAQQILNACREHGIRVPEEIAVMGVDNDDVLCSLCDPPLTSIEPDAENLGYSAAECLAKLMSGQKTAPGRTLIPPARLVERASTDIIAVEDPIMVSAIRFIRDHIGDGIAVKDVSAHLGRSRSDLEKRFRASLNVSVRAEILRRRIARVCQLLIETDWNLERIATAAGFATPAHLCRLFQQQFHQTPTDFRRTHYKIRQ